MSGDRRAAQAIKRNMWKFCDEAMENEKQFTRNDVLREVIKRLRAAKSHIAFHALNDDQLVSLIDECTRASRLALGVRGNEAAKVYEMESSASA